MSRLVKLFPWGNPAICYLSYLINDPSNIFLHAKFSCSLLHHNQRTIYCYISALFIIKPAYSLMPYNPSPPHRLPVSTVHPSPPLSYWFKSVPSYLWLVVNVFCCSKGLLRLAGHEPRLHLLSFVLLFWSEPLFEVKFITNQLEINLPIRI